MKIPLTPPSIDDFLKDHSQDLKAVLTVMNSKVGPCDNKGRYLHWDKIRHLKPPKEHSPKTYWLATKAARNKLYKYLPLKDKENNPFVYAAFPDSILEKILWISENASGSFKADSQIKDPRTKDTYLINSLIDEAINSSQFEGATTTRRVAKEMIRTNREPKDKSEQMIYNNYLAMEFIKDYKNEEITPHMISTLHTMLVADTLNDEDRGFEGKLRGPKDDIRVYSANDILLHTPPPARQLKARLQKICDFANKPNDGSNGYIPTVIKAIIVHFMIGYDHPFVDGNGRTARALFYWIMAKEGYWLIEYISISKLLKEAPAAYQRAYLHSETDDGDLTYFIEHQLEVIISAIHNLHAYLIKKQNDRIKVIEMLEQSNLKGRLNERQLALLKHAMENPGTEYFIASHKEAHNTSYQTARTDILKLSDKFGLLKRYKQGKKDIFIAPPNLKIMIDKG